VASSKLETPGVKYHSHPAQVQGGVESRVFIENSLWVSQGHPRDVVE